ncbi:ERAD-associated E3 ubiquitin-protein ligase HRD1 [Madurella mycetomatis]|uniref:RING-type E3 ubiquitin transferase n=1 Tax=Madurella mycetomatis TaxID=100816 RepID=A0A175W0V1_9PEZI|nr:ERAD-associated E3 ubiquitin-protein ligase HRD1 [Madurella mycetomatis]
MRLAWYAGASTALAATVVASAFYQRANFYSAMVHLAQSSLSLMVLINLVFVVYGSLMYGLQRLCFGPLRPTEIEQLYEKGWFAVTETCLAMTIFREEVGAFFLVMFTALVTGKVWGWIGEGRVEVLEQQPPANPRLFHARLAISLFVSIAYDIWLLRYAVNTVVAQARPSMMVMFLFEFAVLTVCSLHTASRYIISVVEQHVVKTQTRQRLEDRRRHVRERRAEILRRRETEGATEGDNEELPDENDVDEMDIEVPGWEAKGQWVLSLDLFADFVKLGIYTAFFCVLMMFYGLPIHIMRDWFMTTRSFLKRLHALVRYRQALKHMDQYPDATTEELGREDTCIICREEMRPWDPADTTQVERTRAKKLPCGHILHFGCLKSWLERQQVCPTCRRPVAREGQQPPADGGPWCSGWASISLRDRIGSPSRRQAVSPLVANQRKQGRVDDIQQIAQQLRVPADAANPPAPTPPVPAQDTTNNLATGLDQIRTQLLALGQQVRQEMVNVHNAAHELQLLNSLTNELARLRQLQQQPPRGQQPTTQQPASVTVNGGQEPLPHPPQAAPYAFMHPTAQGQFPVAPQLHASHAFRSAPPLTRHVGAGQGAAIPAGSPELPEGVVIPPGWSLLPLQRWAPGTPDPAQHNAQTPATGPPDLFQSLIVQAQNNARSRGPSPAPGAANVAGNHGAAASETSVRRPHVTAPPVTAPIPVAPTWGGPAQLFGDRDRGTGPIFGYQREPTPGPQDESGEGSSGWLAAATTTTNGVTDSSSGPQPDPDVNAGASSRGGARAATVEEAADDDEEP